MLNTIHIDTLVVLLLTEKWVRQLLLTLHNKKLYSMKCKTFALHPCIYVLDEKRTLISVSLKTRHLFLNSNVVCLF